MQVQANDAGDLLLQLRIGAELEAAGPMGLEIVIPSDPENRGLADPDLVGNGAARPMGLALGGTAEGDADDRGDHLLVVGARPPRGGRCHNGGRVVSDGPTPHGLSGSRVDPIEPAGTRALLAVIQEAYV
jgi:hypothetical protein